MWHWRVRQAHWRPQYHKANLINCSVSEQFTLCSLYNLDKHCFWWRVRLVNLGPTSFCSSRFTKSLHFPPRPIHPVSVLQLRLSSWKCRISLRWREKNSDHCERQTKASMCVFLNVSCDWFQLSSLLLCNECCCFGLIWMIFILLVWWISWVSLIFVALKSVFTWNVFWFVCCCCLTAVYQKTYIYMYVCVGEKKNKNKCLCEKKKKKCCVITANPEIHMKPQISHDALHEFQ